MSEIPALQAMRTSTNRRGAVDTFLAVLDAHAGHIADVKRRAEQVYRFETPDRPWFQWDVSGFQYQRSGWVNSDLDALLDSNMQSHTFRLEAMPESDFVPLLATGIGTSDLFARMFGVTFDITAEGAVLQHFNLIKDLPDDLTKLRDVDVTATAPWRDVLERVRFLVEATDGKIPIAHPQMQGPDTWIPRLMDQADFFVGCLTNPADMRVLANLWADIASRLILAMREITGSWDLLRPRQRFYAPTWIKGLIVGDYLTVVQPNCFYEIFAESFGILHRRVGPFFYHTCGPVYHTVDVLKKLSGLAGFECCYVRQQTKTTADLAAVKRQLEGKQVLCSVEYPLGGAVEDLENLTAEWLHAMSQGGGYMMQDSGPAEEGYDLFRKLDLL